MAGRERDREAGRHQRPAAGRERQRRLGDGGGKVEPGRAGRARRRQRQAVAVRQAADAATVDASSRASRRRPSASAIRATSRVGDLGLGQLRPVLDAGRR